MQPDASKPLPLSYVFMCGLTTGAVVSFVEGPFDLFKAKLQVQYAGQEKKYNNAIDAAFKLARTDREASPLNQGLQLLDTTVTALVTVAHIVDQVQPSQAPIT